MEILKLATKTLQLAIQSVVDAIKTKVDAIDTRTTTINTNVTNTKTVVDATKTELAVVDALIDDLITRLGVQASAASNVTSGNAHAKLNWLLSNLATVNTNTATANLGAATSAPSSAMSAVAHAKLNWLLANMPTGIIKSVQRGSAILNGTTSGTYTISNVDPNKCMVLINGGTSATSTSNQSYILSEITATNIKIDGLNNPNGKVGWQVIEFY